MSFSPQMSLYYGINVRECWSEGNYDPICFRRNVLSSKFLLEKYELKGLLKGHSGCVNSVLFSQDGQYIFTGSDDTNVKIYSTEGLQLVESYPSIHTNNIFYARDLPGSDMNTIVTCAADGRVAVTNLATKAARRLHRHRGRAHRIALVPYENNQFYSCGEDGVCCLFDLRDGASSLFQEQASSLEESVYAPALKTEFRNNRDRVCSIYTVGVNPLLPYQVALAGSSNHIALHDSRRFDQPVSYLCPQRLASSNAHVTGIKYDHSGSVLIGSYNDDDVYSFFVQENALATRRVAGPPTRAPAAAAAVDEDSSSAEDVALRGYSRRFTGHRNNNTVKQVSFMGGRSDYVVSGSDCGHLFIWDAQTAKLVQLLKADSVGAINCLSAHPVLPILATSGLEHDAKIWAPTGEHRPVVDGTEKARTASRLTARNSERNAEDAYSSSLLSLLMSLLNRGDLPLHGPGDGDDDSEEGGEESEDSGDGESEGSEDPLMEQEDNAGLEEEGDGAADERPGHSSRRDRWRRPAGGRARQREGTELEPQEESADVEDDDGDVYPGPHPHSLEASGDESGDGSGEGSEDASGDSGMDEAEDEEVSMADLADEQVGIVIDGVPIPWSQLARFLPALLGRRRRAATDTGDEEKEEAEAARAGMAHGGADGREASGGGDPGASGPDRDMDA